MSPWAVDPKAQGFVDHLRHERRSLSPSVLYQHAQETGIDYIELMKAAGHIIPRKPGDPRNLPCGWPGLPE